MSKMKIAVYWGARIKTDLPTRGKRAATPFNFQQRRAPAALSMCTNMENRVNKVAAISRRQRLFTVEDLSRGI